jgi:hypothetical protein
MGTRKTMKLVQYKGSWFLSPGVSDRKQVRVLRCLATMPHPDSFQPINAEGSVVQGAVSTDEPMLTVFSGIRFHGLVVTPVHWRSGTKEPWLVCVYTPQPTDTFTDDYFAQYLPDSRQIDYIAKIMVQDGWIRIGMSEYERAVHVDELDKMSDLGE